MEPIPATYGPFPTEPTETKLKQLRSELDGLTVADEPVIEEVGEDFWVVFKVEVPGKARRG